jgi:eukaryotic-like serine/threonine-protein kinase
MGTGPFAAATTSVRGRYLVLDARDSDEPGVERFTAYDPELARRVQLCVVAIDGAEERGIVMARARALAGIAHRNVAAVLDVGSTEAAIHIASELVDGESLAEHVTTRRLDGRATWRLLAAAGRGLASAHTLGVAHGALRSASLRVDGGRVCVVDFAITEQSTIAGDVRAFAALAIELLERVGAPARFARGLQPALQEREADLGVLLDRAAARERRGARLVLGGVVVGALAGALAVRPAPAQELACTGADRHLAGVWDDDRRAALEEAFGRTGAPWAADVARLVHERLDAHAAEWTEQHGAACRATRIDRTQSEAALELRMACLHRHGVELQALVDTLVEADAAVLARGHDAAAGLADLHECADVDALGGRAAPTDPERAEAIAMGLARARALRDAGEVPRALVLAAPWVAAAHHFDDGLLLARGQILLADLEDRVGAQDVAERTALEGLWSAQRVRADREVAEAWTDLAWTIGFQRGDRNAGERAAEHAAAALRRMGGDPELESKRLGTLGYVLEAAGAYDDAVASFEASLALAEQTLGRDDPRLAQPLNGLAMTLKNMGEYDRAAETFARTLELLRRTVGPEHPQNATVLANLGNLLRARGKLDESEAAHRRALAIRRATTGDRNPEVAGSYHNLGTLAVDRGDYEGAAASFRRAEQLFIAIYGEQHGHVGTVRNGLCFALYLQRKGDEARAACEAALAVQVAAFGEDHPMVASTRTNLGLALDMVGDLDGAIAQHRRSLVIMEAKLGPDHPNLASALANLGEALFADGDAEAAIPLLERAAAIGNETGSATAALANAALGRSYARLGRFDEAIAPLERAIELLKASDGDPQRIAEFTEDLADARRGKAIPRASSSRD